MRCISPFDNGSYHMVTIRTNRTNRQLGEGSLTIQAPRNILSPPNEMHFSIRQRVVSTNAHLLRIDDSKATQQLFLRIVSIQVYWTTLRGATSLDWGWKCLGIDLTDSQMWQEEDTRSMALSTSRAKKYRLKRRFVWYFDG